MEYKLYLVKKKQMKLKQETHHITKKKKRINKEFISSSQSECILAQCCLGKVEFCRVMVVSQFPFL